VLQPLGDEAIHMAVVQGVEHVLAFLARLHQLGRAQQPQLMRDGRRADVQNRRDIAHAEFAQGQRVQDANPGMIPKQAEDLRQAGRGSVAQKKITHPPHSVEVDARLLTGIKLARFV